MKIGMWLLKEKKKVKINEISEMLDVDRRTLLNWRNQAFTKQKKIGRPRYTNSLKFKALLKVGREWKKQGASAGWRPIDAALKNQIPTRLLQSKLSRLKLLNRNKIRARIKNQRKSTQVFLKNVCWVQDGTKYKGKAYQVIKDRGSFKIISVKKSPSETGKFIIEQLQSVKAKRGLPLVLGTDNGSMYTCKEMQDFLIKNKVIHLKSLPRTPQHNGAMECAIREIKEVALLNDLSMTNAACVLNKNRLRARFLFKSSNKIDDNMATAYDENIRSSFYEKCMLELEKVRATTKNKRAMRMNERKIIFEILEQFGFIKFNRGELI